LGSEAFVAFDVSKTKHANGGRGGEVRFLGEVANSPAAVERLIRKPAGRYNRLYFCYEAGPTGYGLYRQLQDLGHACLVVAPALIPKRPGERVKTSGHPGAAALGWRADRGLGAGCGSRGGARSGHHPTSHWPVAPPSAA
jgi:hypothetical protein